MTLHYLSIMLSLIVYAHLHVVVVSLPKHIALIVCMRWLPVVVHRCRIHLSVSLMRYLPISIHRLVCVRIICLIVLVSLHAMCLLHELLLWRSVILHSQLVARLMLHHVCAILIAATDLSRIADPLVICLLPIIAHILLILLVVHLISLSWVTRTIICIEIILSLVVRCASSVHCRILSIYSNQL